MVGDVQYQDGCVCELEYDYPSDDGPVALPLICGAFANNDKGACMNCSHLSECHERALGVEG